MDMSLRAASLAEQIYAYRQSKHINEQCGNLGRMWGELDDAGEVVFNQWESSFSEYNTPKFNVEFKTVLEMLCFREQYGYALRNRDAMIAYCLDNSEGRFKDCQEYVFRADTKEYSYLIRCIPNGQNYLVCVQPYRRDRLDRHIKQAEKGIRFIDPDYKELFRIPDGDQIRIIREDGTQIDKTARYIDEYHVEIGNGWDSTFHICQFAEQMERCGNKVIPLRSSLPEHCYVFLETSNEIGIVRKGETGYYRTDLATGNREENRELVKEVNEKAGLTPGQVEAMKSGSMFGWQLPAADPKNYDEQGHPIKPKRHDRGDAR